jgi:hypothetical protein
VKVFASSNDRDVRMVADILRRLTYKPHWCARVTRADLASVLVRLSHEEPNAEEWHLEVQTRAAVEIDLVLDLRQIEHMPTPVETMIVGKVMNRIQPRRTSRNGRMAALRRAPSS